MIITCYFVSRGFAADEAIKEVRLKRPGLIETKSQEDAVKAYVMLGG